jgi:hypothetical protein
VVLKLTNSIYALRGTNAPSEKHDRNYVGIVKAKCAETKEKNYVVY